MTRRYDRLIRSGRTGVYTAPGVIGPLRARVRRAGIAWYDLDLAAARDRGGFFQQCAAALELPSYFGKNWDAFNDSLLDLAASGAPGAVVHWRRGAQLAKRAPDVVAGALEVLRSASGYWAGSGRVFLVVVERGSAPGAGLPPLR